MTDDGFGCRIRLLQWIGDQFEVFPTMTKVIELTTFDTGQVRLILEPRTPPSGLAPLLQVATERGPSEIVALPVSGDEVRRCVVLLALRYAPEWRRPVSIVVAVGLWVAMFESGIDPVISGLAVGLAMSAYPPSRDDLERATALTRSSISEVAERPSMIS